MNKLEEIDIIPLCMVGCEVIEPINVYDKWACKYNEELRRRTFAKVIEGFNEAFDIMLGTNSDNIPLLVLTGNVQGNCDDYKWNTTSTKK